MKAINEKTPVKCRKTISIKSSPESVWTVLTTIDAWPGWQTEIVQAKLHGKLLPGSGFRWKTGGVTIKSALHTVEPFRYFGWTGKSAGLFAIHNWKLEVLNGETLVTVEESMEGLLAVLLKKTLTRSLEKGMERWLHLLKLECERSL